MRTLRRIVFYVCAAGYLVACPLLIFHALGYSVRPGGEPGVGKTGLLVLESAPPGASIYLEGRRYARRTPAVLSGLWPGRYHAKLIAKRHRPWSRWITIEAEKATVIDKILLVPDQPPVREIAAGPFQSLAGLPETPFVIVGGGAPAERAMVFDWHDQQARPLVTDPALAQGRMAGLWTSRGPQVLLRVSAGSRALMLWIEADRDPARATDVTALFTEPPDWVGWGARHAQLFARSDGGVNRLDIDDMAIYPRMLPAVRGLDILGQSLYALGQDHVLRQHDRNGHVVQAIADNPASRLLFAEAAGECQVRVLARDVIAVLGPQGQLWVSRFPGRWLATRILGMAFDAPRERLLIWQKDRAGIVEFAPEEFTVRWLMNGRDMRQALWAHGGSHVLIRDGASVLLLNVQTPDTAVPHRLVDVRPGTDIAYDEDEGGLLYLDRADGSLWHLALVPKRNLGGRP